MARFKYWPFSDAGVHVGWSQENNTLSIFDISSTHIVVTKINDGSSHAGARFTTDFIASEFVEGQRIILKCRMKDLNEAAAHNYHCQMYMKLGSTFYRFGINYQAGAGSQSLYERTDASRTPTTATQDSSLTKEFFDTNRGSISWFMMKIPAAGTSITYHYYPSDSANEPDDDDPNWVDLVNHPDSVGDNFVQSVTPGWSTVSEVGIWARMTGGSGFEDLVQIDDVILKNLDFNISPIGLNAAIKFHVSYLRTALNGGGNAMLTAPAPFFSAVSAATFKAQEKKQITYTNAFGVIQFKGEAGAIKLSTHGATIEAEEMIRKTMFTEVGQSPIVFSTFLRQWNGLFIIDKDGDFINRGVTTSHIVSFAKADTKVYEGRATRDAFTIVEDSDMSTPFVPNIISNGRDEDMYYFDIWDADDTNKAHQVASTLLTLYAVKYPVNLYEKFNNLTKLNNLDLNITFSAIADVSPGRSWTTGSARTYKYRMFNYQSSAWEDIKSLGENDLSGVLTTSVAAGGTAWHFPIDLSINLVNELKIGVDLWLAATGYVSGDRVIETDILYTCILNHTSSAGNQPPDATNWQRTVYDFIDYESTAGSAPIFSKLNCIMAIRTTGGLDTGAGFWVWSLSVKATFDEDNEPEFSSASINAVSSILIQLNTTSGIDLPEEDGFGVGDVMAIVKSAEDYLQDTWDISVLASDIGALNLNITNGGSIGVSDDHTFKSFFILMQHISELTNSTFWADYDTVSTVEMVSADNHAPTGVTLTRLDIEGYNTEQWEITYDATKQRNQIRILGDNVNFLKTITPDADPFDLGDEIEIIEDSNIQTLLQASNLADSISPRFTSSEITASVTLNYSAPNQNYTAVEVGKTIALKLPTASDTSIANFSSGNDGELLIIAIELNRNDETGDQDHVTLMLQRRYS